MTESLHIGQPNESITTIGYTYDPLSRLTLADYCNTDDYAYTYDAVGNTQRTGARRLTQVTDLSTTTYAYDIANHLKVARSMTTVNGVTYTWDNNHLKVARGNLINDGVNTYAYTIENRLSSITNGGETSYYYYNGLGDRLFQLVDGVTTHYMLDMNAALTQVLTDGTQTYLYGLSRLGQKDATTMEFFLGDAPRSCEASGAYPKHYPRQGIGEGYTLRQMTDSTGTLTLEKSYTPFGEVIASTGTGESIYGYTGEVTDESGLVYLRARYYLPESGRLLTKDYWPINYNQPITNNHWIYVDANPIINTDPTGNRNCKTPLSRECQIGLSNLYQNASFIKNTVYSGSMQPVEGFAWFIEKSKSQFTNIEDLIWAMTLVIDDFDKNNGPIWAQANRSFHLSNANSSFFIQQDWLAYMNNPIYDKNRWCDPINPNNCVNSKWTYSLRGDWNPSYWDKTANQAYHFWFSVAVTFFDGDIFAFIANEYHDRGEQTTYDFINSNPTQAPPPYNVSSRPDKNLSIKGMELGHILKSYSILQKLSCHAFPYDKAFNIEDWIRANLK